MFLLFDVQELEEFNHCDNTLQAKLSWPHFTWNNFSLLFQSSTETKQLCGAARYFYIYIFFYYANDRHPNSTQRLFQPLFLFRKWIRASPWHFAILSNCTVQRCTRKQQRVWDVTLHTVQELWPTYLCNAVKIPGFYFWVAHCFISVGNFSFFKNPSLPVASLVVCAGRPVTRF